MNRNEREFRISINMGYGQVFKPEHLERTTTARQAALDALDRYFGAESSNAFTDLIVLPSQTYGRTIFEVYLLTGQGGALARAYTILVDDLARQEG